MTMSGERLTVSDRLAQNVSSSLVCLGACSPALAVHDFTVPNSNGTRP
jgi:hypothetical protein